MIEQKNSITSGQLVFIIVQTQIGVGILSLPYSVQKYSGGDSWISVLVAGLVVQLLIFLFYFLCLRFPKLTLIQMAQKLLGRYIGGFIGFLYAIYFLSISGMILLSFTNIINVWFYPNTPNWIIIGIMILISAYLVRDDLRIIARFAVLVSVLLIIVIAFVGWSFSNANFLYVLPINQSGIKNIFIGTKEVIQSILGFELLLFVFPFVQGSNKAKLKAASIANIFVTVFYMLLVFSSLVSFSPNEITLIPQPTLYLLKALSTTVIERIDLFFMSIWTVIVSTTFVSYLYLSAKGVSTLLPRRKFTSIVNLIALLVFLITILPINTLNIGHIEKLIEKSDIIFIGILPCLLLFISLAKRKTG